MNDAGDGGDSVSQRNSRLHQLFMGRCTTVEYKSLVGREGLMDALLVLFNECNNECLMKNEYISQFVKKYKKTIEDIRKLRINVKDFEVKSTIGRGHFGEVQVVREKHSGDVYALKVLRKADTLAQKNVAFYEEERDIMAKASSPWLTRLQYAFQDQQNLYLVMEFHPGGDLLSLLARYDDQFEEKMAQFYLAEMVMAVHTLHAMGYVHRDVKPENVLIDRTGHVKLADFGSACRLADANSSVSNMPVGTPDYICPEVLMKMNSDDSRGKFNEECDWWSLGVCAYEMMFSTTPFTDDGGSMVVTYSNIMNFKKTLKFPNDADVSSKAVDLMKKLLTDAEDRLRYEAICIHGFFADINFDSIRHTRPPFIPTVTSKDDTSNFDEIEKARPAPNVEGFKKRGEFSGKDLPFIGFTFTKDLANTDSHRIPSLTHEVSSPAAKASLERRLTVKSQELQTMREKFKQLESRSSGCDGQMAKLQRQLDEKEKHLEKVERDREVLERDVAHYITEVNSLKRLLEIEKQEQVSNEQKALSLLDEIREGNESANKMRDEMHREELEAHKEIIAQLEDERQILSRKIERLDKELRRQCKANEDSEQRITLLNSKISKMQSESRTSSDDNRDQLEQIERESAARERELQSKLDKAIAQSFEATELLQQVRQGKSDLEEELLQMKVKAGHEKSLKHRLTDSEERRKSLETQMHRMSMMEKREELLKNQLQEKSNHVTQLAERIADLEEKLHSRELEYKKCEKLYSQREDQLNERIEELQSLLEDTREDKSEMEEKSLCIFEENEDRMRQIQEHENTITLLKANVTRLEEQVSNLRSSLEDEENQLRARSKSRSPCRRRSSRSRRSGFTQTDSCSPFKKATRRSGFAQTDGHSPAESSFREFGFCQTDLTPNTGKRSLTGQTRKVASVEQQSKGIQTSLCCSPLLQRSHLVQTDLTGAQIMRQGKSPNRQSGAVQTDLSSSVRVTPRSRHRSKPCDHQQTSPDASSRKQRVEQSILLHTSPGRHTSKHLQTQSTPNKIVLRRSDDAHSRDVKVKLSISLQHSGEDLQTSASSSDSSKPSTLEASMNSTMEDMDTIMLLNDTLNRTVDLDPIVEANSSMGTVSDSEGDTLNTVLNNRSMQTEDLWDTSGRPAAVMRSSSIQTDHARDVMDGQKSDSHNQSMQTGNYSSEDKESRLQGQPSRSRRRQSEEVSDLKQMKLYLELKIDNLQRETDQAKEAVHQQRIRALDFKHELREKTVQYEKELSSLKEKLNKAELSLSDATETVGNLRQKEGATKAKFEKTLDELETLRSESRISHVRLQEDKEELEMQIKVLRSSCQRLEKVESNFRETSDRLRELETQESSLKLRNKELESSVRLAQDEKNKFLLARDQANAELSEKRRHCEQLEQRLTQLKSLCSELEHQMQVFEDLLLQAEQKESQWKKSRESFEKAAEKQEDIISETKSQFIHEKQARTRLEDQKSQLQKQLETVRSSFTAEVEHLKEQLYEQRTSAIQLNTQLTDLEKAHSVLGVDNKSLQRRLETALEENTQLKEETSKLITGIAELKGSSLKISKNLEEAMDRYELLASQNTDLENRMETAHLHFNHDKYKLDSTIGQQTKLIDYLQAKVENPPKKKKGLFSGKPKENGAGIQVRELQHSLEHERDKNTGLRQQILRLRDDLHQAQSQVVRLKGQIREANLDVSLNTTAASISSSAHHAALSTLVMSPTTQPSPGSMRIAHVGTGSHGDMCSTPKTPTLGRRPKNERMHHNIPHRFVTGLNSRPTKCAVCLGSVHFVKVAAKCQECHVVCHPKCAPSLPAMCGLPTEYARHYTEVLTKARAKSSNKVSVADLHLQMQGWMKVPRPGKQLWEKKWVILQDNCIHIYNSDNTEGYTSDEFDLCPSNGDVTVHSAVTAAELTNTASSDLPFILRLEFEPHTTCWPGRSLYLMCLNFSEKQRWVATLEAIVCTAPHKNKAKDAKLLGNTILTVSGNSRIEVNSTLPLSDKVILVGADEGLYALELAGSARSRPLVKVTGIEGVYQITPLDGLDMVAMITGPERQVVLLETAGLNTCVTGGVTSVKPKPVKDAVACTTFACGERPDGVYLCVALAESILVLKFDDSSRTFEKQKELLTSQACSCMYFGKNCIIVGTDKFYRIDLQDYSMREFLDKKDSSLAFAAFGAAHYDSFPIAVIKTSTIGEVEEFLLCYHEFGVFVDSLGRRKREEDVKWGGLPLAFAYEAPYLYVIHFTALQVIEILPSHFEEGHGAKTVLALPAPRYLGPALSSGAIYIGSANENMAEILCFRGNMVTGSEDKENEEVYTTPAVGKKYSPGKRKLREPSTVSDSVFVSPPPITPLSQSPKRKTGHIATATVSNSDSSEETDSSVDVRNFGHHMKVRSGSFEKRRRFMNEGSDSSF